MSNRMSVSQSVFVKLYLLKYFADLIVTRVEEVDVYQCGVRLLQWREIITLSRLRLLPPLS